MSYPYSEILPFLQLRLSVAEYLDLTSKYSGWRSGSASALAIRPRDPYWRLMPRYTFAYCPICGAECGEPIDLFSFGGWGCSLDLRRTVYANPEILPPGPPCPHFLGIHLFLNLHGVSPTEREYFENRTGEVPYLSRWAFASGAESYAVLHALPICRIWDGRFVPSYTAFILTYFSDKPKQVLEGHLKRQAARGRGDAEFFPGTLIPPGHDDSETYELADWARRGRLSWIDPKQVSPPRLAAHRPDGELPAIYHHVEGIRQSYVWRNGRIRIS